MGVETGGFVKRITATHGGPVVTIISYIYWVGSLDGASLKASPMPSLSFLYAFSKLSLSDFKAVGKRL